MGDLPQQVPIIHFKKKTPWGSYTIWHWC